MATIAVICGLSSTMTCTSGTYEILPVADLQASPLSECNKLGEIRSYYPVTEKLNYSSNSACQPGRLICSLDRFGLYRWTPIADMAPFTPSDLGAETCNGKDDDCNGTVDDVAGLNGDCTNDAGGFCHQKGTIQCNLATGSTRCNAPAKFPLNPPTYYTYQYLNTNGIPGWDWDCSGMVEAIFCLQSGLTQGSIAMPSTSICNTNLNSLVSNVVPSPWDSTMCKSCPSSGGFQAQWGVSNITFSVPASNAECGKSISFVKCVSSGTGCVASGSDTIVVACK